MSIGLMIAGLCFLFLPNVQLVDPLPDFIGFLLLLCGCSHLSWVTSSVAEAAKGFKKLCYITLLRMVTLFLFLFFFRASTTAQANSYLALFTFVFCGIETAFAIIAFRNLFAGMSYLQLRHGATVSEQRMTDLRTLTYVFLLVKAALNILPTLHGLFSSEYSGTVDPSYRGIEQYTTLLNLCNLVFVTALGIVWFIFFLRFLLAIKKKSNLLSIIEEQYRSELQTRPHMLFHRDLHNASVFLCAAAFFGLDLAADKINLIPDPICAVLLGIACYFLLRQRLLPKKVLYLSIAAVALSLVSEIHSDYFNYVYADLIYYRGLSYHPDLWLHYLLSIAAQILWQGSVLAICFYLIRTFRQVVTDHTGAGSKTLPQEGETENAPLSEREVAANARLHRNLHRSLRALHVFVILYTVSCVLQAALLPFLPSYWLIHIILGIIVTWRTVQLSATINDQIEYRYL